MSKTIIHLIITMILIFPIFVSQSQNNSDLTLRYLSTLSIDNELLYGAQMSSSGQYIAAVGYAPVTEQQSQSITSIYFWRLISDNSTMNVMPLGAIPINEAIYNPEIAFSPNETSIALKVDDELKLYSLPNLELLDEISIEQPSFRVSSLRSLAWARNSDLLLAIEGLGETLVLWDLLQGNVIRHTIDYSPQRSELLYFTPEVAALENTWIISGFYDTSLAFVACTLHVEECLSYEVDSTSIHNIDTDKDGQYILVSSSDQTTFWERDTNIEYEIQALGIVSAYSISPEGNYLFAQCVTDKTSQIIEFPSLQIVQVIEYPYCPVTFLNDPLWLLSESFFTLFSPVFGLQVYERGQNEPVGIVDIPNPPENVPVSDRSEFPIINADESLMTIADRGIVHIIQITHSARSAD